MSVHQCPKCELRFTYKTELDDHCWHDHPQFRHEYPASAPPPPEVPVEAETPAAGPPAHHHSVVESLGGWLTPKRPGHTD